MLDKLFGRERSELHTRHELGLLITEHLGHRASELDDDEVEIIKGALQLSEKRVRDILKPIKQVYWLQPDAKINAKKIDEIKRLGWSRIPVFNKKLTTCYGVLLIKDMLDVNFDHDSIAVQDLPLHGVEVVGSMTALDTFFRKFISGKVHLIPIEKNNKIIGIVTIEDLLEEIVGHEIEDETDRSKGRKLPRHT